MIQHGLSVMVAAAVLGVAAAAVVQPKPEPKAGGGAPAESKQPATDAKPAAPPMHSATTPAERTDGGQALHPQIKARIDEQLKKGPIEVLFIGDSITEQWGGPGKAVWDKHFVNLPRNAANMGVGGDRTQHVLWRLEKGKDSGGGRTGGGELDAFKPPAPQPKVAVVMIGTNNSNGKDNTAQEIADGVGAIVLRLREALPETKVLLLGVFPRGEKPNAQREKIAEVNTKIKALGDGKQVMYWDIGDRFMEKDGSISKEIMPDALHLSEKGYEIWAAALEEKLPAMLGEKK